jgi:hypothetical protein
MSDDPVRLREGGSPFLKKALASARSETPDESRAASLEARILPLLLPPMPPPPPPAGAAQAAKLGAALAGAKGLALVKGSVIALAAAAILAGAGAGALYVAQTESPNPSVSGVLPTEPLDKSPPSTTVVVPSAELVPLPSSVPPVPSAHTKPTAPMASASAQEAADPNLEAPLLRSAQDALRTNPSETLAKTQEHARKYPRGLLVQEREVMAIEALLKLGRRDEAASRAERFSRSFPGSTHQRRIDALLGEKK